MSADKEVLNPETEFWEDCSSTRDYQRFTSRAQIQNFNSQLAIFNSQFDEQPAPANL
jgi:hypothetical protein